MVLECKYCFMSLWCIFSSILWKAGPSVFTDYICSYDWSMWHSHEHPVAVVMLVPLLWLIFPPKKCITDWEKLRWDDRVLTIPRVGHCHFHIFPRSDVTAPANDAPPTPHSQNCASNYRKRAIFRMSSMMELLVSSGITLCCWQTQISLQTCLFSVSRATGTSSFWENHILVFPTSVKGIHPSLPSTICNTLIGHI